MKIANIRAYPVTVDQTDVQRTSQGITRRVSILVVRIDTDSGLVGWGEGLARRAVRAHAVLVEEVLAPELLGADPFAVEALWQRMFRVQTGRPGIGGLCLRLVRRADRAGRPGRRSHAA